MPRWATFYLLHHIFPLFLILFYLTHTPSPCYPGVVFPILSFLFHLFPIQNDNKNTCSSTMPHTLTLLSWCCVVFQRLVRAVGVPGAQGEERAILVLSANSLQKWYLAPGKADQLVYECNVEKHIRESFVDHVWVSLSVHFLSFFFLSFFLSFFFFFFFFFFFLLLLLLLLW